MHHHLDDGALVTASRVSTGLTADNASVSFLNTAYDTLRVTGSNDRINLTGNTDQSVAFGRCATHDTINAGQIKGFLAISDFAVSDTLVLRNPGYASAADAFAALQPTGLPGGYVLNVGSGMIMFTHAHLTAASLVVVNT